MNSRLDYWTTARRNTDITLMVFRKTGKVEVHSDSTESYDYYPIILHDYDAWVMKGAYKTIRSESI